jgi:hypothetical protein
MQVRELNSAIVPNRPHWASCDGEQVEGIRVALDSGCQMRLPSAQGGWHARLSISLDEVEAILDFFAIDRGDCDSPKTTVQ